MRYVKLREVEPAHRRHQIEAALAQKGWSLDDLSRKLGYLHLERGRADIAELLQTGENVQLLRRISTRLGLDHEEFSGERPFAELEDYLRFTFKPVLLRVPSSTIPSPIFPVAFAGLNRILRVDKFPELLDAPTAQQDQVLRQRIREDYVNNYLVMCFKYTIGYVFYYKFGQARAYSVRGESLPHVSVLPVGAHAEVRTKYAAIAAHSGAIHRLKDIETQEIYENTPFVVST
ncbi:MAG: helix-turn-helix transcriptional regulator [Desulfuromonas sp.]|nr:helix-turn-helix transcriptional regulator [Desulfuromonas sp.]